MKLLIGWGAWLGWTLPVAYWLFTENPSKLNPAADTLLSFHGSITGMGLALLLVLTIFHFVENKR